MQPAKEIAKLIEKQLNLHFGTKIKAPAIRVYFDPQEFANDYTGVKKKRTAKELIAVDNSVSYYYNDELKLVCFKGFRRNGAESFKKIKHQTMKVSDLTHEFIHHWQVETGGYSKYNVTDEGCCEIINYVLSADMPHVWDYGDYICGIWAVLDSITTNSKKKYELVKQYNISKNKTAIANKWFDAFLSKNPKLKMSRQELVQGLESDPTEMDKKLLAIVEKYSQDKIANELYRLHDSYKSDLLGLFKE